MTSEEHGYPSNPGRPRPPEEEEWAARERAVMAELDEDGNITHNLSFDPYATPDDHVLTATYTEAGRLLGESMQRKQGEDYAAWITQLRRLRKGPSKKKRRKLAIKRLRRAIKEALYDLK